MLSFPNCKINLGLKILDKRNDGFHNLETVFYPLQLKDALEVIQSTDHSRKSTVDFSASGIAVNGKPEDNLCIKAYELLKKDFSELPAVQIHLHKAIPTGAGLGGGSSDGAFILKLFNQKFNLGLSTEKLVDYALQLGSDCPFFIINKPCFATGRGEFIETISLDLSVYKFFIVNPGIHIKTKWAFDSLTGPRKGRRPDRSKSIKEIVAQPVETWKEELKNDFEESVFEIYPEIKKVKDDLYKSGAVYASMTGSGSSVYGIFHKYAQPDHAFPENYFVKESAG